MSFQTVLLVNGMRYFFFPLFFLTDSVEYLDIVLSEIKDMSETAFSALFSLTLIKNGVICTRGIV